MNLLLHACCGPCLLYPANYLTQENIDFTAYFYNPNIHPYKEFRARLDSFSELCDSKKYKFIADRDYGLKNFLRMVVFREKSRCRFCYHIRLNKTAELAAQRNFDAFSSTLFYSKYQNHSLMKGQCTDLSSEFNISFFYRDFREGWLAGIDESITLGIYRQKYCGCIYSEQERFDNRLKKKLKKERKSDV